MKRICTLMGCDAARVEIVFVSSGEMRRLNRTYRRADKDTDVLTFTFEGESDIAASIIISISMARKQAAARRVTLKEELLRLMVHGVAHSLGHEHDSLSHFLKMRYSEASTLLRIL